VSYNVCKFMVFLSHQLNLAEIPTFEQIIAHSNLNIFARFKGGFNIHFSVLSIPDSTFVKNIYIYICEVKKLGQTEISSLKNKYSAKLYRPINGLKGCIQG
jgi:hypothetical protein